MTTHQQKKLDDEALLAFRDRFALPLADEQADALAFYKPADDSAEMRYLHERRAALGGYLPRARTTSRRRCRCRRSRVRRSFALHAAARRCRPRWRSCACSATLLKDPALGPRVVPIVADEARTFGMANLFRQVGIYSAASASSTSPRTSSSMLYYREAEDGQILEEGITEAGAISSWIAAATVLQRCTACRCCRSTSTTRCSASSASAT